MFNVLVRDEINSLPALPPPRLVKGKTKRGSYLWKLSPVFIQKAVNERIHVEQRSRGLRPFPLCHFYSASGENRASSEGEITCCYETSIKSKTWPIGKSGLRFRNPDFGFATKRRIWKRIWALTNISLDVLSFFRFYGKSAENGFKKLFSRTAISHAHAL